MVQTTAIPILGFVWFGCDCKKKAVLGCEKNCCELWAVRKLKFVWLEIAVKLYEVIKRSNFGIMSSPHSLKFDLVFLSYFYWSLINVQKIQIKNRKMQIWVNLNRIYASDGIFEKFLHQRAWNSH
jgi:hypothetical protein